MNGCTFKVNQNLFGALMGIVRSKTIVIWIDAICINQKDDEEKGWQVAMMGDIYRKASKVFAWLGPSADNSDSVIEHLNVVGAMAEACDLRNRSGSCARVWRAMMEAPPLTGDPNEFVFDGTQLPVSTYALQTLLHSISGYQPREYLLPTEDLCRLHQRAWWSRVWVLQEISLPKHAQFVCGTKRIPRQRFFAAHIAYFTLIAVFTRNNPIDRRPPRQVELLCQVYHGAHTMLSMSDWYQNRTLSLAGLLQAASSSIFRSLKNDNHHQHLQSTDPRDMIFAILGLAHDKNSFRGLGIVPNHSKSTEDVYTDTMAALLRCGYTFLLSLCHGSGNPGTLPSWVIDWSIPAPRPIQGFELDRITPCPRFNASGSESASCIFAANKRLRVRSILMMTKIYDIILQPGRIRRVPGNIQCALPDEWVFEVLSLTYISDRKYTSFRERMRAVIRASYADIGVGEDSVPHRLGPFSDTLVLCQCIKWRRSGNIGNLDLEAFLECEEMKQEMATALEDPYQFDIDLTEISSGRSPFITQKGHLGISSMEIKEGDVIALFGGTQMPFVLRQCERGKYMIISEAYVDEIMDGEAAEGGEWGYVEFV